MDKLGALAAFGTASCWAISALFFESTSKRLGALTVNFWKVIFAFAFLAITGTITRGMPFPIDASPRTWLFLSLSGLVGFVISDFFLFNAYVYIGARTAVVFQAITPFFTALFAYIFLGERMDPARLVGMVIVVCGILMVVITRQKKDKASRDSLPHARKGYLYAFLSTIFQAGGLILSKVGLGDYSAVSGTQIRVFIAIFGFAIQALVTGQAGQVFVAAPKDKKGMRSIGIGAIFGPFLGVVFSLFAMQHTQAGTASTLMALTPVLIIPLSVLVLKQKVDRLEIIGAVVAVCGAALFFML
ncbi:MAG: DMT family transporter [Spirochaetaceae bacterium]|nr:DMT family transporter [Spirochaetaceae bacterium]